MVVSNKSSCIDNNNMCTLSFIIDNTSKHVFHLPRWPDKDIEMQTHVLSHN